MNRSIIAVSMLLLSSCANDYKRDVFLGFQLGTSYAETDVKYQQLHHSGVLKKHVEDGEVAPYYYTYTIPTSHKNYYSMILFNRSVGDTIISSITLIYLDKLSRSQYIIEGTKKGYVEMNLNRSPKVENEASSDLILADVLKDLTSRYGQYDSKDSREGLDRHIEEYCWKNRKDVDITLSYATNTAHNSTLQSQGFNVEGAASLVLEYAYIDEVKKKLIKNSHLY